MNTRILTLTLLLAAVPWAALAQTAFTKITAGSIVNDSGLSQGCSWGDFNNDGYIDLFVANYTSGSTAKNYLYQNNGDGTFTKLTTNSIVTVTGNFSGGVWGDFDNDGLLDLYVLEYRGANSFYRNQSNGAFAPIPLSLTPIPHEPGAASGGAAWGDYDNDGFLDLFVSLAGINDVLYRNNGDGTFTEAVASTVASEGGQSATGLWGDYDNDGHLDLFVPNAYFQSDYLYHNNGDGTFVNITDGPVINDSVNAWGDYNNDGFLDLAVAVYGSSTLLDRSLLYQNNGDGTFQSITDGVVGSDTTGSASCAWGDYDNDGFLDLFIANGINGNTKNFLFHNNGDGTFVKVTNGVPVNESVESIGAAWGDYDNDGFLDLFVANGNTTSQKNFLYHNRYPRRSWPLRGPIKVMVVLCRAIHGGIRVRWELSKKCSQLPQRPGPAGLFGQQFNVDFQGAVAREIHRFIGDQHLAVEMSS